MSPSERARELAVELGFVISLLGISRGLNGLVAIIAALVAQRFCGLARGTHWLVRIKFVIDVLEV